MGKQNSQKFGTKKRFTVNRSTASTVEDASNLDDGEFAIPDSRRYPIHNEAAANRALVRVAEYGTDDEQEMVQNAVEEKWPGLKSHTHSVTANSFSAITFNLDTPRVRYESLEGRDYTVVPMVMITEGVHAGSNGPLYYPAAELSKTPAVWNHKPIVVYHPTENGSAISACEPAVISKRKVGIIMNAKYVGGRRGQPGKLKAEAWLETNRMKLVDERVATAVTNKQKMEVSTGLFTDNEQVDGRFGKKDYTAIARNYRPDHLAILPDEEGACSIRDGGGLMQNGASHSDIRDSLSSQLRAKKTLPAGVTVGASSPYVRDVYDNFCVYSHGDKTFKHDYNTDDSGNVTLKGTPAEVTSKQVYQTTDGKVLNTGAAMNLEEIVEALIENAKSPFDEDDREYLEGLSVNKLKSLAINSKIKMSAAGDTINPDGDDAGDQLEDPASQVKPKRMGSKTGATKNRVQPAPVNDDQAEEDNNMPMKGKKGMENNSAKPPTMDEYIANAPEGLRDVLVNGVRAHNQHKARLIQTITANDANVFTEQQLRAKGVQELQSIAALAAPSATAQPAGVRGSRPVANYAGLGDASFDQPVDNTAEPEEALEIPVLNFSRRNGKSVLVENEE